MIYQNMRQYINPQGEIGGISTLMLASNSSGSFPSQFLLVTLVSVHIFKKYL